MNKEMETLNQGKELTIKSTELVNIINQFRKVESEASGKKYVELLHKSFITKIEKELETLKTLGLEGGQNILLSSYIDSQNKSQKCYELNGSGMRMMLNSESTIVRFKTEEYIENLENKLKQQIKLPSYSEALRQLADKIEENEILKIENKTISLENRLLNKEVFEWAGKPLINALVRKYGATVSDFGKAWTEFKKSLLYSYGININSRITNYLNASGKKTKPKTLDMLKTQEEISNGIATIISMCKECDVNIIDVLKHYSEGDK
jgi:phage regulator Rha-like protein